MSDSLNKEIQEQYERAKKHLEACEATLGQIVSSKAVSLDTYKSVKALVTEARATYLKAKNLAINRKK